MSTRRYVETSALLRALLDGDEGVRPHLVALGAVTSALTFLEATRAIARARREGRLDARSTRVVERQLAAFERSTDIVALGDEVLARARQPFPVEPVRSLDAVHLATVRLLDEELGGVEVVSCDDRVRKNAEALGFVVLPRNLAGD